MERVTALVRGPISFAPMPKEEPIMNCQEFLERYSEFRDFDEADTDLDSFKTHLDSCPACHRYHEVVERGVELARSFTGPSPREDFEDRLRHRIYHADLVAQTRRRDGSSPLIAVALAAAAVLAGVGAWGPISTITSAPTVDLPGISASAPQVRTIPGPLPVRESAERSPAFLNHSNLWSESNTLLYEHSNLYHRYRDGTLIRTGLH
ncbi:MAG: hypothetical protein EA351_12985 [Gemmatimonadales bacterium]|nr:MAG: hypothetical protein EA351_12985 [Gemmatimonadales bacterium]